MRPPRTHPCQPCSTMAGAFGRARPVSGRITSAPSPASDPDTMASRRRRAVSLRRNRHATKAASAKGRQNQCHFVSSVIHPPSQTAGPERWEEIQAIAPASVQNARTSVKAVNAPQNQGQGRDFKGFRAGLLTLRIHRGVTQGFIFLPRDLRGFVVKNILPVDGNVISRPVRRQGASWAFPCSGSPREFSEFRRRKRWFPSPSPASW